MKEHGYVSYTTCGIDATEFYREFNVTISGVSRATGTCRESVSKVPIHGASKPNTEKIVAYLEEVSIDDYQFAVKECKESILHALRTLENEWQKYGRKEKVLENYRSSYQIPRKRDMAEKETLWNVLRCIKEL